MLHSAFILLGGKKETTYRRMLSELKTAILEIKLEFRPTFRLRVRGYGDDIRRYLALAITTAKNTYLLSSCTFDDLENFLDSVKVLVKEF